MSSGAKRIRIALILGLNTAMLGGGIWLLLGYLNKRDLAAAPLTTQTDTASSGLRDSPKIGLPTNSTELATGEQDVRGSRVAGTNSGSSSSAKDGDSQPNKSPGTQGSPGQGDTSRAGSGTGTDTKKADARVANTEKTPILLDAGSPARRDATERRPTGQGGSAEPTRVDGGAKNPKTPVTLTPEEEAKRVRIVASKVTRVVASHSGQLSRCYKSAQKITTPDHPIEGVVKVQFAIQSDGSAKSVRVSSNSTTSPSLAKCVAGLVRGWSFPQTPGPDLDFEWPFEFQAPK